MLLPKEKFSVFFSNHSSQSVRTNSCDWGGLREERRGFQRNRAQELVCIASVYSEFLASKPGPLRHLCPGAQTEGGNLKKQYSFPIHLNAFERDCEAHSIYSLSCPFWPPSLTALPLRGKTLTPQSSPVPPHIQDQAWPESTFSASLNLQTLITFTCSALAHSSSGQHPARYPTFYSPLFVSMLFL